MSLDAGEMETLKSSLYARGQQTPIEIVQTAPGRYGLISGFRRVQALQDLARTMWSPGKGAGLCARAL